MGLATKPKGNVIGIARPYLRPPRALSAQLPCCTAAGMLLLLLLLLLLLPLPLPLQLPLPPPPPPPPPLLLLL